MKFPNPNFGLGSATMSGDFSEILIADYIEYILNYIVPRVRYRQKFNRNTSTQGSDLIGYKVESIETNSINDEMLIVEEKLEIVNQIQKQLYKMLYLFCKRPC